MAVEERTPTQLVVLGMHRSGTSGVTRLLNLAGAWFGPDGIATAANAENPKGFWERRDVRAVCDGLLAAGGFEWWRLRDFDPAMVPRAARDRWSSAFGDVVRELDEHAPWVVKEPRLCVLLPLLREQLTSPLYVHVTREPLEVAQSVHRRDGLPLGAALALWELYTVRAFEASAGSPRVLVRYEDLMADPVGTTRRLITRLGDLGVSGLRQPDAVEVTDFISADLHRQHADPARRRSLLNQDQADLAARIDDGSILLTPVGGTISEGAMEALRLLEDDRSGPVATAPEIEALERRLADESRYREAELARRREMGRAAEKGLAEIDEQLRRYRLSTVGRVARKLVTLRQIVTPGVTRTTAAPLDPSLASVAGLRRDLAVRTNQEPAPGGGTGDTFPTDHPLIRRSRRPSPTTASDRASVAVLSWDVGHNPLGRANVLAEVLARRFDVELWGAQFDRYGSQVWSPLRRADTPVNVFAGGSFPQHLATMDEVARVIDADAIWVSKPRLPSYGLGILAKVARNRPLVLDVDDHELAFFGEDEPLGLAEVLRSDRADLLWPFERAWTRACDGYIDAADQVTVSNVALQHRYGGLIVPHARDERRFDPARFDREEVRRRLGVEPHERLLLFGGTPRAHKGVVQVLEALERLGDERYRVLMFGTREFDELRGQIGHLARWALVLPAQSFDDLPGLVVAADLACVIQDPDHPVSRYQMPAKISDALAMGVPCLVTPTPPLAPLIDAGVLQVLGPDDQLHERIARVFDEPDEVRAATVRGRALFLRELSYEAVAETVAPVFERLLDDPPPVSKRLLELANAPARAFAGTPGVRTPIRLQRIPRRDRPRPAVAPGSEIDVVMFWKQNDSGIYGRRQDMFLEALARSGRVRTIVHFDNPISPEALVAAYRSGRGGDQRRLVATESVARVLRRRDEPGVVRDTYLFGGRYSRRLGRPTRQAYVDHVQAVLARQGVGTGSRPLVLWAYPSNDDLPGLIDALDPDLVVADVVDDNRTWYEAGAPQVARIEENYRAVLARSDVVLANCAPVAASMQRFADEVHVVPNGAELPDGRPPGPRPKVLAGLRGPIIAYVGNLSARLDTELLDELARSRPDWTFAFVGSTHLDRSILELGRLPNVHFLGVLPYREVRTFLAHVDVALIPHVDNEMTRSMNPLKAFVYAAAGVPVVATPVANLAEFEGLITVAGDAPGFEAAISAHLAGGRPAVDVEVLRPHSWEQRLAEVFALVDRELGLGEPG